MLPQSMDRGVPMVTGTPLLSGMAVEAAPSVVQAVNGVQFQVVGSDIQMVEVMLQPKQTVSEKWGFL